MFEPITEFELYKEFIKHVCTRIIHIIWKLGTSNIQLFTDMWLLQ